MIVYIIVFILSLSLSFIFAGFETGLVSLNKYKVSHSPNNKNFKLKSLVNLLDNQSVVISSVLIGNNFSLVLLQWSFTLIVTAIFGTVSDSIISPILTIIVLMLGELLPKSLFRIYSYKLTLFFAPFIYLFKQMCLPIVKVIDIISSLLIKSSDTENESSIVIKEITSIASAGGESNNLEGIISTFSTKIFESQNIQVGAFILKSSLKEVDNKGDKLISINISDNLSSLLDSDTLFKNGRIEVIPENGKSRFYRSKDFVKELLLN